MCLFRKKRKKEIPVVRPISEVELEREDNPPLASDTDELLTNDEGIVLIMESEGFYSDPYICPAGVPTIGYGTTYYPDGTKVSLNDFPITKEKAVFYLQNEINEKENVIEEFLSDNDIVLNSNEFSALVSFAYNLGNGPVITPGKTMCDAILSGNRKRIANAFLVYNKARVKTKPFGIRRLKELRGLTIRRNKERNLFLKGSSDA